MSNDHSKEKFKEWLKSLPPETEFCRDGIIYTCPIAVFTGKATGYTTIDSEAAPQWVSKFTYAYSDRRNNFLSEAIRIAEEAL